MAYDNTKKLIKGGTVTLLSAAAANSTSDYIEVAPYGSGIPWAFTVQHTPTGSPTSYTIKLQGSIDGATFFDLGTDSTAAGAMFHVVNKPVRYLQANLSNLGGGSSPKVTVVVFGA